MFRSVLLFIFTGSIVLGGNLTAPVFAADTDKLSGVLEKIDNLVCSNPE